MSPQIGPPTNWSRNGLYCRTNSLCSATKPARRGWGSARQVDVPASEWAHYDWDSRAAKYHRSQIRDPLGFREATVEDGETLAAWLDEHVLAQDRQMERLRAAVIERCRALHIEPPAPDRVERLIRSASHRHEERFRGALLARLPADTRAELNARYRNPDEDLPADFDARRDDYYAALGLPQDAKMFIAGVRQELRDALEVLDRGLDKNPHVKILNKSNGWISLSPLDAQLEPVGLAALKAELVERWPMTGLLDILKETELRLNFTEVFRSPTLYESLDRNVLRERLLLSLHGLGTNTGLKRMAAGQPGTTYKDLLYVRRRFITREHLREAITRVVNATFRLRQPGIWGEATTACASDSKKFSA